jgi:photosystem II stability/assembly factor-like uncharacterized protein
MWIWLTKIYTIRILLTFLSGICLIQALQAQWIKQSPLPTGQTITDACFINPDTGWIFGLNGTILHTDDGGLRWTDQSSAFGDISTGLFLDDKIGWIASFDDARENNGKIFGTSDGGFTWNLQFSDLSTIIRDLSFINSETGWALACCHPPYPLPERNFFLKTADGGENWMVLDSIDYVHFIKIEFINDTLGFIAGTGMPNLMKTTDGGMTWRASPHVSDAALTDVFFTDTSNGFSCGNNLYYTHNGGQSWGYAYCYHSYAVDMYDAFNGWTISIDKVYKVTNGGQNADYQLTTDKSLLTDISAIDSAHAIVFGRNVSIYSTGDGGSSWQEMSNGTWNDLYSVFFLNDNDGWAGGNNQTLLRTHDGGKHWAFTRLPSPYPLTDIQFINSDTGWLISGDVHRTVDGGLSWLKSTLPGDPVSDLYFIDSQMGWCVGSGGLLYRSFNGGIDWQEKNSGTEKDLKAVYFVDEHKGWIAGEGVVLKSTDGGESWEMSYESQANFLKIQFLDESIGYVLADEVCIETTNGGADWQTVLPEKATTAGSFSDICFINPIIGFISDNNSLMKTTDGGVNWVTEPVFPDGGLKAIYFIDELSGWVVGSGGLIYHTESGGTFSIKNPEEKSSSSAYIIYPNPSGGRVKISYRLDRQEDVQMEIYTLQGLRIGFYNEVRLNPGSYTYEWDPGDSPGIYLCKIRIGALFYTEKIVYSK